MSTQRVSFRRSHGARPLLWMALALAATLHAEERIGLVGEVRGGYLLGGVRDGLWMEGEVAKECVGGGVKFRTFTLAGATGREPVSAKVLPGEEPCPETVRLDFGSDDAREEPVFAVACPWNPAPRKVTVSGPANKTYQAAAAEVLKAAGVAEPRLRVDQVLRADLDGDGEEEAIVVANTFPPDLPGVEREEGKGLPAHTAAGYQSLVFVRRLVGDKVHPIVLVQEIGRPQKGGEVMPVNHAVAAILDLNGDGKMEVVCHGHYYEGEWFEVYQIEGLAVKKVLSVGCGA